MFSLPLNYTSFSLSLVLSFYILYDVTHTRPPTHTILRHDILKGIVRWISNRAGIASPVESTLQALPGAQAAAIPPTYELLLTYFLSNISSYFYLQLFIFIVCFHLQYFYFFPITKIWVSLNHTSAVALMHYPNISIFFWSIRSACCVTSIESLIIVR